MISLSPAEWSLEEEFASSICSLDNFPQENPWAVTLLRRPSIFSRKFGMACCSAHAACETVKCPKPARSPTLNQKERRPQAPKPPVRSFYFLWVFLRSGASIPPCSLTTWTNQPLGNQVFMEMNLQRKWSRYKNRLESH